MEHTKGKLTFEISPEPLKHCSYGDLILNGKIFARDIHRDHAIDTMRRWNCHDQLLEACKEALPLVERHSLSAKRLQRIKAALAAAS